MASWTKIRRRCEAVNLVNHLTGWNARTRVIGGIDEPRLTLLTSVEPLTVVWSSQNPGQHLLAGDLGIDDSRRN